MSSSFHIPRNRSFISFYFNKKFDQPFENMLMSQVVDSKWSHTRAALGLQSQVSLIHTKLIRMKYKSEARMYYQWTSMYNWRGRVPYLYMDESNFSRWPPLRSNGRIWIYTIITSLYIRLLDGSRPGEGPRGVCQNKSQGRLNSIFSGSKIKSIHGIKAMVSFLIRSVPCAQ